MPPKPAPASEQAAGSPFESLLDDSAPPPPPADNTSAAQPDAPPPEPKGQSGKSAKADDAVTPADTSKPLKTAKTEAKTNVKTDVKTAATVAVKIDAAADTKTDKSDGDGKHAHDNKSDAKTAEQQRAADVGAPIDGAAPDSPVQLTPDAPQMASAAVATGMIIAAAPEPVARGTAAKPNGVTGPLTINTTNTTPTNLAAPSGKPDAVIADTAAPDKTAGQAGSGKPQAAANGVDTGKDQAANGVTPSETHRFANAPAPAAVNADTQAAAPKAPDAPQPLAMTAPVQNAAPSAPAPAPAAAKLLTPQAAAIPLAGVGIEIAAKALEGKNRFEIRLDPPELGRIEVRLDVNSDGNVATRLIADRADTLDLLRRDSSGLERALQDAGLKTSDNGMQFLLRDQSMNQQQSDGTSVPAATLVVQDDSLPIIDSTQSSYSRFAGMGSGIDIRI
jgi:flagellar hook-length control protein FliK